MNTQFAKPLFTLVVVCISLPVSQAQIVGVPAESIQFTVKNAGRPPLPLQAIRVQSSVRNITEYQIGPVHPTSGGIQSIKLEGDPTDRELHSLVRFMEGGIGCCASGKVKEKIYLNPDHDTTGQVAYAANWIKLTTTDATEGTLFPKPGNYTLNYQYSHRTGLLPIEEPTRFIRESVKYQLKVQVAEPQEEDLAVYRQMVGSQRLTRAMLSPINPVDLDLLPTLKKIVADHPSSSYTDYARFAIARAYCNGFGNAVLAFGPDLNRQETVATISQFVENLPSLSERSEATLFEAAKKWFPAETQSADGYKEELLNLQEIDEIDDRVRVEKIASIYDRIVLNTYKVDDAIEVLEGVKSSDFAYYPDVLVLKLKLYTAQERMRRYRENPTRNHLGGPGRTIILRAMQTEPTGKLRNLMELLTTEFDDYLLWNRSGEYVSPEEWKTMKKRYSLKVNSSPAS